MIMNSIVNWTMTSLRKCVPQSLINSKGQLAMFDLIQLVYMTPLWTFWRIFQDESMAIYTIVEMDLAFVLSPIWIHKEWCTWHINQWTVYMWMCWSKCKSHCYWVELQCWPLICHGCGWGHGIWGLLWNDGLGLIGGKNLRVIPSSCWISWYKW